MTLSVMFNCSSHTKEYYSITNEVLFIQYLVNILIIFSWFVTLHWQKYDEEHEIGDINLSTNSSTNKL